MIENYLISHPPIEVSLLSHSESSHTLVAKPMLPGFGYTFGNSIRRILLSSIPGFAVTAVRINDITHEYQGITGVVEDAYDIVLNLKGLRAKILTDEDKVTLKLSKKSVSQVTAADFEKQSNIEIVNPDLYICSLDKTGSINIEIDISRGVGFKPIDQASAELSKDPRNIFVDAFFNPVTNVSLDVEKIRVGERTDFDKIEINFETDRSQDPKDIVAYALKLSTDIFSKIESSFLTSKPSQITTPDSVIGAYIPSYTQESDLPIKESVQQDTEKTPIKIDSKRIRSILEKNNIFTDQDLLKRKSEISEFSGISEKSLQVINDYIKTLK